MPGENMVIMPENSETAKNKYSIPGVENDQKEKAMNGGEDNGG